MYFEQNSLIDYFLNLFIQSSLIFYIGIVYSVVGSFIVSASRFYCALCESWKLNFDEAIDFQKKFANEIKIKGKIVDTIEYHLDIFE